MKILYIGNDLSSSTSFHRANALRRIGHQVEVRDPYFQFKKDFKYSILNKIHYLTGYYLLQKKINNWIVFLLSQDRAFDLIWINSGELIGPKALQLLKTIGCPTLLYNNDDPTGTRDGNRFKTLLKAISFYDLVVIRKEKNNIIYNTFGVNNIFNIMMSYDEIAHKGFESIEKIDTKFKSDIVFVGTWIRGENRDIFILELIKNGLDVSIWGNRWSKSPHWNGLKKYHKGNALSGDAYISAIQGAKICLGFISKANGDLHTRRSVEIPFSGGLLCAERTSEHIEMYEDGVQALFWKDAEECISICKKMLADDNLRERIRLAGMKKVVQLKVGNEDICKKILLEVDKIKKSTL